MASRIKENKKNKNLVKLGTGKKYGVIGFTTLAHISLHHNTLYIFAFFNFIFSSNPFTCLEEMLALFVVVAADTTDTAAAADAALTSYIYIFLRK